MDKIKVSGKLRYAAQLEEQPDFIKDTGETSVQKQGRLYEQRIYKKVKEQFPEAIHNPWYEYIDSDGKGWCSPDIIFFHEDTWWILECKLTYKKHANTKLKSLYKKILKFIYGKKQKVKTIHVFKNFTKGTRPTCFYTLNEILPLKRKQHYELNWRL